MADEIKPIEIERFPGEAQAIVAGKKRATEIIREAVAVGRDSAAPINTVRQAAGILASVYLKEHADDGDEIISREWIEREFPEWLRFYGGVGVASILIRQEGGNRWELQVWPFFGGDCVCDIRLIRQGCVPPQFQLDIGSLRTRDELRRLLKMLDRRVTPETK